MSGDQVVPELNQENIPNELEPRFYNDDDDSVPPQFPRAEPPVEPLNVDEEWSQVNIEWIQETFLDFNEWLGMTSGIPQLPGEINQMMEVIGENLFNQDYDGDDIVFEDGEIVSVQELVNLQQD